MPSAPGRFSTTTAGLPGRYLERNGAISRPVASVPPPACAPTTMVMVLPLKLTGSCANADAPASATMSPATAGHASTRMAPSLLLFPSKLQTMLTGAAPRRKRASVAPLAHLHTDRAGGQAAGGEDQNADRAGRG